MTHAVTLLLPEPLYEHFRQRAEWSHRGLEVELLDAIAAAAHTEFSSELIEDIEALEMLSDEELWRLRLAADETLLLQAINREFSSETWQHYATLKSKRQAETLTPQEQAELIALSDKMEEMNARRMAYVVQLASLRHMSVASLMEELDIKSPLYE